MIEIKKYANRRLYDTAQSVYITLADLAQMVQSGVAVKICDAKSGEDLTSVTLLQILAERQQDGVTILSPEALAILISHSGDETITELRSSLDAHLHAFAERQLAQDTDHCDQQNAIGDIKQAIKQLNHAILNLEK